MSNTELLIKEIETLPANDVAKVIDFVGYLKYSAPQDSYVCPICGKTEHTPNAETIAALQETQDMIDGKIPSKGYHSISELIGALSE
jgi:hypothetical protein